MSIEFVILTQESVESVFNHTADYMEAKDIARKLVLCSNKPVMIYKVYRRARLGVAVVFDDLSF